MPTFASGGTNARRVSGEGRARASDLSQIYRVRAKHARERLDLPATAKEIERVCVVLESHPEAIVRIWSIEYEEDAASYLLFELLELEQVAGATLVPRRWPWKGKVTRASDGK